MTTLEATAIVSKATRCTEATLMAFGIHGIVPTMGSGCLEYLRAHGFKVTKLAGSGSTLKNLEPALCLGNNKYLIFTHEHAMALIDGILIDTAKRGFDNRKIEHIWEVTKGS